MKIETRQGVLIAQAESLEDIQTLLSLNGNGRKHKKHKKHMHTKTCDICGKECKGKRGLGIHKAKHRSLSDFVPKKLEVLEG